MSKQADQCINESCAERASFLVDSELYREPLPMCLRHAQHYTDEMSDLEVIKYV